ncbi:hypothetical protein H0H92_008983 [Tricholoma furcatifolium]|nr:hypothetical protein H0H92_008983 [Tricholoma furcatifolium]
MIWAGLANLNQAINATVWNGNAINWAPVWCDISSHFFVGVSIGIPCASLCINRRLYQISAVRSVTITKAEKRRAVMIDLAIAIGIPMIYMALSYIVQGHRFNIYGDIGCFPAVYYTTLAVVLVSMPPILVGCVSAVYSVLSIRAFARSRSQFKELLSGSNSSLNSNRYIRLMLLAGIETALTVPVGISTIIQNAQFGIYPWLGWEDTHSNFSQVIQIPSIVWRQDGDVVRNLELNRFFTCLCALLFFAFFGFAEEARKHYRLGAESVCKRLGISTSGTLFGSTWSKSKGTLTSTDKGTVPVFVERQVISKADSLDSFSDSASSIDFDEMGEKKDKDVAHVVPAISYEDMKISDIGGTLPDFQEHHISPTPSSGSSASSFSEPTSPHLAPVRPDSIVEVSSVRYEANASNLALPVPSRYVSDSSAV